MPLVAQTLRSSLGPFVLQAAIVAEHCKALRAEDTGWRQIVRLYDALERIAPSPIVVRNRAVATAMTEDPWLGLAIIDTLAAAGDLDHYHLPCRP